MCDRRWGKPFFAIFVSFVVMSACSTASAQPPAQPDPAATGAPKDQFSSVIYIRSSGATEEMYRQLEPQTAMAVKALTLKDIRSWGGKYKINWFDLNYVDFRAKPVQPPDPNDPDAGVGAFKPEMWDNWDAWRAAGVLTGPRPANYDDLFAMTEAYARAQRDGAPLPARIQKNLSGFRGQLCISNPEVVRIIADIKRFDAHHCFSPSDTHDNGGFVDLDQLPGYPDYSEFSRKKFEAWLKANYTADQIKVMLNLDPAAPIPLLTPKGADADVQRVYKCLRGQFFNTNWAEFCRAAIMDPIKSVLGKGNFDLVLHGDGYAWRTSYYNMPWWGPDAMTTYCTECGHWPGARHEAYYAAPSLITEVNSNEYDYEYGAGRLWGEPVMVKTVYGGQIHNSAGAQLGVAEGMALLGNMGIYTAGETAKLERDVHGSWVLPMVQFAQKMTPQIRQMIPAARVGVVFDPADRFAGFDENDKGCFELSRILHRQHVPMQVVHLEYLEETLAQRPMDVLILPYVRCIKDSQAAALIKFVENGGKIIFVGDECGAYTWEAMKRPQSALASILPPSRPQEPSFLVRGTNGKRITATIAGPLDSDLLSSGQNVQVALFGLLGITPSCIAPDHAPLLLTNLTRNSNNTRFYMCLVNYDIDQMSEDAAAAVRPVENVRVVIPLPAGVKAKSATLYRQEADDLALPTEDGTEGVAVTVPKVQVYAIVAVEVEPGARPARTLVLRPDLRSALEMIAAASGGVPSGNALATPPGPLPPDPASTQPRTFSGRVVAYARSDGAAPAAVQLAGAQGAGSCNAYDAAGKEVLSSAFAARTQAIFAAAPNPPGTYVTFIIGSDRSFQLQAPPDMCLSFEASQASPLRLDEAGDSEPFFFYVPKDCKTFNVFLNTRQDRRTLRSIHMVVKDCANAVALDFEGQSDGMKPYDVKVPEAQAGKVWSLWFLNAGSGATKKTLANFYLDGVPPVVSQCPCGLLIATKAEQ